MTRRQTVHCGLELRFGVRLVVRVGRGEVLGVAENGAATG